MVYVFLADGFEEVEALTPVDLLRRADVEVRTVGVSGRNVTGAHGVTVTADIPADEVDIKTAEMIVLPGGYPGYVNLETSDAVQTAIDECAAMGRFIAAICAAPTILGHKGLLRGKSATCFPGMEGELEGAVLSGDPVVRDGMIVTSRAAGTAADFALCLIGCLAGDDTAERIRAQITYGA